MSDHVIATWCDDCGKDIDYGQCALMVPDGYDLDGLPVVGVICAECAWGDQ